MGDLLPVSSIIILTFLLKLSLSKRLKRVRAWWLTVTYIPFLMHRYLGVDTNCIRMRSLPIRYQSRNSFDCKNRDSQSGSQ